MERIPVSSSNIASIGYNPVEFALEIEFLNGRIYQYYDVPEEVFNEMMAAESHGQYFYAYIRLVYPYQEI